MSEQPTSNRLLGVAVRSPLACCGLLALFVALIYPLVAWYAHGKSGADGLLAAAVAGVVCWLSASAALLITAWFPGGPQAAVSRMMLSMLVRMGVPLAVGTILEFQFGPLADAGVFGLIVVFYLMTLLVETMLSLRFVQHSSQSVEAS